MTNSESCVVFVFVFNFLTCQLKSDDTIFVLFSVDFTFGQNRSKSLRK